MNVLRVLLLVGVFTFAASAPGSAQVVELIIPQVGVTFVSYSGDLIDSDTGVGFEAGGKIRGAAASSSRRASIGRQPGPM